MLVKTLVLNGGNRLVDIRILHVAVRNENAVDIVAALKPCDLVILAVVDKSGK